jgi:hypothetical protein
MGPLVWSMRLQHLLHYHILCRYVPLQTRCISLEPDHQGQVHELCGVSMGYRDLQYDLRLLYSSSTVTAHPKDEHGVVSTFENCFNFRTGSFVSSEAHHTLVHKINIFKSTCIASIMRFVVSRQYALNPDQTYVAAKVLHWTYV